MDGTAQQEPTDAQLTRDARDARTPEQRRAAFTAIVERHRSTVVNWCGWHLTDQDAALDVGQSTFADAFASFIAGKGPDHDDKLPQWLIGIAKNRRLQYLRTHGSRDAGALPAVEDFDELAADEEARSGRATRAAHVRRLVERVAATLEERERLIYRLRFEQELPGHQVAARLGVSEKTGSNQATRVQQLLADGFGALILAQEGRAYCPVLAGILEQAAFSGENFTAVLRVRIVKHFDTCATCDSCGTCARKRRELVGPYVPVLIPLLIGAQLREKIAEHILQYSSAPAPTSDQDPPDSPPTAEHGERQGTRRQRIRRGILIGLIIVILVSAAVLALAVGSSGTPAAVPRPRPGVSTSAPAKADPRLSAFALLTPAGYQSALSQPVTGLQDDGGLPNPSTGGQQSVARTMTASGIQLVMTLDSLTTATDARQYYTQLASASPGSPLPGAGDAATYGNGKAVVLKGAQVLQIAASPGPALEQRLADLKKSGGDMTPIESAVDKAAAALAPALAARMSGQAAASPRLALPAGAIGPCILPPEAVQTVLNDGPVTTAYQWDTAPGGTQVIECTYRSANLEVGIFATTAAQSLAALPPLSIDALFQQDRKNVPSPTDLPGIATAAFADNNGLDEALDPPTPPDGYIIYVRDLTSLTVPAADLEALLRQAVKTEQATFK